MTSIKYNLTWDLQSYLTLELIGGNTNFFLNGSWLPRGVLPMAHHGKLQFRKKTGMDRIRNG